MSAIELHPLCTLFPRITGAEFDALVLDIKQNGLREPIIVHDGMILDGGNRYRACIAAGVEPKTMKFGGGNLVSYVLSANLHRRHLSAMQAAAIVASAQDWANANLRGGDRRSDQSANLHFDSVADRAAQSGVSERTQKMADKIVKADPDLAKALGRGEVMPSDAVEKVTGKRPGAKNKNADQKPKPDQPANFPVDSDAYSETDQLRDVIADLQEERARLIASIEGGDGVGELQREIESLRIRVSDLESENARLSLDLHNMTVARDIQMDKASKLQSQVNYMRRQQK